MSVKYPLSVYRRVERQWAERIKSLSQVAIERMLQYLLNNEGSLIPVPARAVADRRRLDRFRPRD